VVEVQICEVDALPAPFSLAQEFVLGLFSIVGFPWLHHTSSLFDVTMEIKARTLLQGRNDIKAMT
jgi:hypothetical protein